MSPAVPSLSILLMAGLCALSPTFGVAMTPPARPVTPPNKPWNPQAPKMPGGPGGDEKSGAQLVRMNMSSDVARIKPTEKFHLAFIFNIEPKWHIYWENSGTSGAPTEIDVKAPPGFVVGRTLFPRPLTIKSPEGNTYGYEDRTVLLVEITPPETAVAQVTFSADVSWLVCKGICKKGNARATLTLPFGDSRVPDAQPLEIDPAVEQFKARLPQPLEDVSAATVVCDGKTLTITLPAEGHTDAEVFPNPSPGVEFAEARVELRGGELEITVPLTVNPNNAMGKALRVAGVVGLGNGLDDPCYVFDLPLSGDPARESSRLATPADGRSQRN